MSSLHCFLQWARSGLLREHCVTIKQTGIRAGRRVYHVNLKNKKKFKGPEVFETP